MPKLTDPLSVINSIEGIISEKKQISEYYIDLTLGKLYRIKSSGSLDFGGSEYQPSNYEPCPPLKKRAEDSYGWWALHEGYFFFEYNEKVKLPENQIAILQPHQHLLYSGCSHPTLTIKEINENFRTPFWVPKNGVEIKENARISQLLIIEF